MSAFSDDPDAIDPATLDAEPEDFSADAVDAGDARGGSAPTPTRYPTVDAWVQNWLLVFYRRPVRGRQLTWCPEWWRHPEAKLRLTALWQTWEAMRLEPPFGMADWLRVHCDHHMPILMSPDGPLKGCEPEHHTERPLYKLPTTPDPTSPRDTDLSDDAYLDPGEVAS
jgi:hypothetical protein